MLFLLMLLAIVSLLAFRKKVDLVWVACISFIIYFYPFVADQISFSSPLGQFDYVVSPYTRFTVIAFAGIIVCYLILERILAPATIAISCKAELSTCKGYAQVTAALVILSLSFIVADARAVLLENDKPEIMKQLGYVYKFFSTSTLFLLCFSYFSKWRFGLILVAFSVAFDLFLGFRTTAAFSVLSFVCLYFSGEKLNVKKIALTILLIFFLFLFSLIFKPLLVLVKTGNVEFFLNLLQGDGQYFQYLALASESTSISIVFNEILSADFSVKNQYLIDTLYQLIPFVTNFFNASTTSFADYYKQGLMGEEASSFASSFWGAVYASIGYIGMFSFFLLWLLAICLLNSRIGRRSSSYFEKSLWIVVGVPLAFYIHRNDFIFQYSLFKSALITASIIYALYRMIKSVRQSPPVVQ